MKQVEILIIDNNIQDTMLIRETLNEYNSHLNLRVAQNYVDAINFLFLNSDEETLSNLQLILLESSIPDEKCGVLLHQIKEHPELRKIPLLIMTQSSDPDDAEYFYNEYVNAYLHKPESKEEFSLLIKMILKFWMEFVSFPEHVWS